MSSGRRLLTPLVAAMLALPLPLAAEAADGDQRVGPGGSVAPPCGSGPPLPGATCVETNPAIPARPAPDIRFPDYQAVADQIARTTDPVKRKRAEEYLAQARAAWEAGFHETALDLLRTAVIATY